jgi:hypothetical protein
MSVRHFTRRFVRQMTLDRYVHRLCESAPVLLLAFVWAVAVLGAWLRRRG